MEQFNFRKSIPKVETKKLISNGLKSDLQNNEKSRTTVVRYYR